jgi:putative PIN family toxin of toxin-antitoxin system
MNTAKSDALRAVLDSNIYVSAFTRPQGTLFRIWSQAVDRRYRLIASAAIVNEVGGVLRLKFGWDDIRIVSQLRLMTSVAEIVTPASPVNAIPADEDDNRILECAVAGRASLIVSLDRHLLSLKTFQGIAIIHPSDFRRILGN